MWNLRRERGRRVRIQKRRHRGRSYWICSSIIPMLISGVEVLMIHMMRITLNM